MRRPLLAPIAALLAACGGGGGGDAASPPPPPPTITLTGQAVGAERVALTWTVNDLYANQAYAITIDDVPVDVTAAKSYLFRAAPDTRYCFKVVVGSWLPPLVPFAAAGPESAPLCLTTPSLPPLDAGWQIGDAGLGSGKYPALARRSANVSGPYACNASIAVASARFGYLGQGFVLPKFERSGEACSVAYDDRSGDVHVVTRSGHRVVYQRAGHPNLVWFFGNESTIAGDADASSPVSVAVGADRSPQVLYSSAGKAYWARPNDSGNWGAPEFVGAGTAGWRSLAIGPDGTPFALISDGSRLRVLARSAAGWTVAYAVDDAQAPSFARGAGSITATALGLRVAYRRQTPGGTPDGIGVLEWAAGAWTAALVDAGTATTTPAIASDGAGEPLIAYGDANDDLRLARRVAGAWKTVIVDARGDLARQVDVEVDTDGRILLLYSDEAGAAKLAIGR